MIDFTEEQIQRYSRHILLQDVGVEGQEKIMNARVLVVGAGGLGAPVSLYLAAAGIGRIGIVDADVVDLSNLQRQIIHFTKDVGVPKAKSAEEKIKAINPDVKVDTYYEFLDSGEGKRHRTAFHPCRHHRDAVQAQLYPQSAQKLGTHSHRC